MQFRLKQKWAIPIIFSDEKRVHTENNNIKEEISFCFEIYHVDLMTNSLRITSEFQTIKLQRQNSVCSRRVIKVRLIICESQTNEHWDVINFLEIHGFLSLIYRSWFISNIDKKLYFLIKHILIMHSKLHFSFIVV